MADSETRLDHTGFLGEVSDRDDWPARASATVVRYVGTVRDKTTGPALRASRSVVYLAAAGLIGVLLAILLLILVVRVLVAATGALPFVDAGDPWLAYLVIGIVFLGVGMYLWRKKDAR